VERVLVQDPSALARSLGNVGHEVVRYGMVSVVALAVDAGTLSVLTEAFGVRVLWSSAVGFLFGLITNYALSIQFVFPRRSLDRRLTEFMGFSAIGVVGLGLTQLVLWLLSEAGWVHYLVAKSIAVVVVFMWNYGVRKALLFS
jgi:putative flippase GtrA